MPLENRLSNSYDPSMGFAEGIRNLGKILAQGPAIRARAAYMSAEGQRANAMSDEAVAHANLYQSQAEHEDVATAGLKQIGDLANKGLLRTDKEGNLVVDASLASQVLGGVLQQSKGANDAGGGLAKTLGAFNAPVQADLARQNKSDIATAGDQTKLSIADKNVAGRLAAAAARPPGAGMQPYEQTEVRQIKNPAYVAGSTNAPTIDVTNRISRVVGNLARPQPSSAPSAARDPLLQDNTIKPAAAPVTPQSQEEFDALPSGALYINPADGKQYRKK